MMTRVTVPNDPQLVDAVRLGEAMWSESGTHSSMPRDVDKMIEFAYAMRSDPQSFFNVALHADTVTGFLIGSIAPYGFSHETFAYDRLVYVTPNKRGTYAARMLIRAFEHWAKHKRARHVMMGTTTGINTDAVERLYNKLGFRTVGKLTMKEMY